jgi:TonB family protein
MMNDTPHTRPASCEHLFDPERDGGNSLYFGMLAAVAIHIAVFAITWPTLSQQNTAPPGRMIVCRFPVVRYREPPPLNQRFTTPPRRIPIPDPDPLGPELITAEVAENYDDSPSEDYVPFIPVPPPIAHVTDTRTVVDAGIDIDPPKALYRVEPAYTEAARKIRFEGVVVLSLLIGSDGRVADVTVLRGLPFGLTENAVSAARQWRFEACTFNGNPVSVRYTLTIQFRIAH